MTTLDTITSADYPDVGRDLARARLAGFAEPVIVRLLNYVAATNLADKVRQSTAGPDGTPGPFPRQRYYRLADPHVNPNIRLRQKYLRIVDTSALGDQPQPVGAVVAFVEIATGLVYKPDGWKRPAKGVRGSFATDEDAAKLIAAAGTPYHLYAS